MLEDSSKLPRIRFTRLNKLMSRSLNRAFQKHDLSATNEQELILRNLRNVENMTQTELASVTGQDRYNISRTIALMEQKGLIRKEPDDDDRRFCRISLTPEGEETHQKLWEVLEEWRGEVFAGIEVSRLEEYAEVSELLMKNLNKLLGDES